MTGNNNRLTELSQLAKSAEKDIFFLGVPRDGELIVSSHIVACEERGETDVFAG